MKNKYSEMQAERDRPPVVEGIEYFHKRLVKTLSLGKARQYDIQQPKFDGDITVWYTGLPEGVERIHHGNSVFAIIRLRRVQERLCKLVS